MSDAPDEFDETQAAPAAEHVVAHEFTFKGKPLAPYSFARKVIFQNLREKDDDPVPEFFTLALVFILLASKETAQAWIFDAKRCRRELLAWMEDFDPADYQPALDTVNAIIERSKNRVQPEASGDIAQKKT